jgi:iron complex outermembrane recepter protein
MVAQASLRRLLVASISLAAMAPACAFAQTAAEGPAAPSAGSAPAAHDAAASTADATADAAANSDATSVNELVVTARHEAEKAIDVPIALTALPKQTLQQNQAYTLADVQNLTPSLVAFQSNARNSSIGIRGIGVSSASDGLDTTVGVYVDGVYLGRPGMALTDLIDVDQVEVLRGPQGTLFGRNAAAGAVNITTSKPTFTPEFTAEGSYGNFNYEQLKVSASGPLIDDKVAARITAFTTHRDGVLDNTFSGTKDNSIGRSGARLQFLLTPNPKLTVRIIADASVEDDTCCVSVLKSVLPTNFNASTQATFGAFANLGYVPRASTASTQINSPQNMLTDQHSVSGQIDYDLGFADFTSITAYRYWHFHPLQDSDGTPLDIIQINVAQTKDNQYSQEFRLTSKPGRLTWQAGVYLFKQDLQDHFILNQYGFQATQFFQVYTDLLGNKPITTPLAQGSIAPLSQYIGDTHAVEQSAAAFGQANFKITDRLILTGGLRYTYDDKSGVSNTSTVGTPYVPNTIPFHYNVAVYDTNLSYLASITYKITPNFNIYTSYSTGYQSAGLNLNAATTAGTPLITKPELVSDWEAGVKASLFDHRVGFDVNVFDEDLTGLQANIALPGLRSYLANVGNVRAQGVEGDVDWNVVEGLTLSGNASYNDTRYTSYPDAPAPSGVILPAGTVPSLTGKPVYQAPKWIVNAVARYEWTWNDKIAPYVQVKYSYRASAFGDVADSPGALIPAYSLVDARIGAKFGTHYDASLWVENAANQTYFNTLGGASITGSGLYGFSGELGPPRTFGATLRAEF